MKLSSEQFIINAKGRKTGVILSYQQYQQLLDDLQDLAVVAERRHEETITLAKVVRRTHPTNLGNAAGVQIFRFGNMSKFENLDSMSLVHHPLIH